MSLNTVLDIAGSGLTAESRRMSTSASNMANANVESSNAGDTYRAQYPVFQAVQEDANKWINTKLEAGVVVSGIYESDAQPIMRYDPNNPVADKDGYVYVPNISYVEEMANMISASRSYQMDLQIISSAKQLIQRTLQLGQ
ncbi:flagellar basal body rod protein FlgC [Legionella dresdenensis]|uniref:Flagellar basal-body rod protein FlgC n=1 Tax=Legionella dresdenensis TaxID=450200 RepID=A0ABV8CBT2_9GAMM